MIPKLPAALIAALGDHLPGLVFGLPLIVLASIVFAATHHEQPAAIRRGILEWLAWLGGTLGVVLLVVAVVTRLV
jgi:uncharacterized membrane protein YdcZ (DUF606 family)